MEVIYSGILSFTYESVKNDVSTLHSMVEGLIRRLIDHSSMCTSLQHEALASSQLA